MADSGEKFTGNESLDADSLGFFYGVEVEAKIGYLHRPTTYKVSLDNDSINIDREFLYRLVDSGGRSAVLAFMKATFGAIRRSTQIGLDGEKDEEKIECTGHLFDPKEDKWEDMNAEPGVDELVGRILGVNGSTTQDARSLFLFHPDLDRDFKHIFEQFLIKNVNSPHKPETVRHAIQDPSMQEVIRNALTFTKLCISAISKPDTQEPKHRLEMKISVGIDLSMVDTRQMQAINPAMIR